jgi:hypothetical protein
VTWRGVQRPCYTRHTGVGVAAGGDIAVPGVGAGAGAGEAAAKAKAPVGMGGARVCGTRLVRTRTRGAGWHASELTRYIPRELRWPAPWPQRRSVLCGISISPWSVSRTVVMATTTATTQAGTQHTHEFGDSEAAQEGGVGCALLDVMRGHIGQRPARLGWAGDGDWDGPPVQVVA